jgi:hypothetical protein
MSVPTAYTEQSLARFMEIILGKVAKVLELRAGVSDPGDFSEAVNDALLAYGTDDISTVSGSDNIQKLRALAAVCAWRHVVTNFAALYDFSADGGRYSRSQLFEQAKTSLEMAEQQALPYAANYMIHLRKTDHIHDPYQVRDLEDRTL